MVFQGFLSLWYVFQRFFKVFKGFLGFVWGVLGIFRVFCFLRICPCLLYSWSEHALGGSSWRVCVCLCGVGICGKARSTLLSSPRKLGFF